MNGFIPGNTMTENVRALAWSALPDAPVQPDDTRPPGLVGRTLRRLLRWRPVNTAILAEADRKNVVSEGRPDAGPDWRAGRGAAGAGPVS